jgi:hypothetical protein
MSRDNYPPAHRVIPEAYEFRSARFPVRKIFGLFPAQAGTHCSERTYAVLPEPAPTIAADRPFFDLFPKAFE